MNGDVMEQMEQTDATNGIYYTVKNGKDIILCFGFISIYILQLTEYKYTNSYRIYTEYAERAMHALLYARKNDNK